MWFQLQIEHCPNQEIDKISEELEQYGALSIMLTDKNDDPILEPEPGTTPLWPEVIIQALFANISEAQAVRDMFSSTRPTLACQLEVLPDKDWERAWMDDFKPQRFGQNLWVCPTWLTPPDPDAVNLMLDPGLAFGTGTHPTTSLCLTWLDQADINNKTVVDYGCGSGILSLAALKLGAKCVYAVDIDNQALQATQNNAISNDVEPSSLVISAPDELQSTADLIIANILLAPLISLKYRFHQLLNQDAQLVVSGLLAEQVPILIEAYEGSFTPITQQTLDGWSLVAFAKK